jgi:hypothetical protein
MKVITQSAGILLLNDEASAALSVTRQGFAVPFEVSFAPVGLESVTHDVIRQWSGWNHVKARGSAAAMRIINGGIRPRRGKKRTPLRPALAKLQRRRRGKESRAPNSAPSDIQALISNFFLRVA